MKPTPRVAIIIVNWNGYDLTRNCLISLLDNTYPNYEILLVDNGSSDGSVDRISKEFNNITILPLNKNLGFTGGNNYAMSKVLESKNHEYVLLLNNDTEVESDFLTQLISFVGKQKNVGAVQPIIHYLHDKKKIWNSGGFYNRNFGVTTSNRRGLNEPLKVDWLTGCCFLVSTDILEEVGLFNEKYFAYYEDVDLSFRIASTFRDLYVYHKSKIYHVAGASGKNKETKEGQVSPKIHYYVARNKFFLLRSHVVGFRTIPVFGYNLLRYTAISCYFLFRGRFSKLQSVFSGIFHGLTRAKI